MSAGTVLPALLFEMVRGNAPMRDLLTEGFTTWEIDAARAIIRRDATENELRISRRAQARGAVTTGST